MFYILEHKICNLLPGKYPKYTKYLQREVPLITKKTITPLRGVKVQPKKLGKIEERDSETTATRN